MELFNPWACLAILIKVVVNIPYVFNARSAKKNGPFFEFSNQREKVEDSEPPPFFWPVTPLTATRKYFYT